MDNEELRRRGPERDEELGRKRVRRQHHGGLERADAEPESQEAREIDGKAAVFACEKHIQPGLPRGRVCRRADCDQPGSGDDGPAIPRRVQPVPRPRTLAWQVHLGAQGDPVGDVHSGSSHELLWLREGRGVEHVHSEHRVVRIHLAACLSVLGPRRGQTCPTTQAQIRLHRFGGLADDCPAVPVLPLLLRKVVQEDQLHRGPKESPDAALGFHEVRWSREAPKSQEEVLQGGLRLTDTACCCCCFISIYTYI
mmetsp:Transcript_1252/g.3639  ORF Transcript_1252/g.3639 Transcript_1252/m.3639 type:complete len:253 (+) Transcript_1252:863-1621(+)